MKSNTPFIVILIAGCIQMFAGLCSCTRITAEKPEGFAEAKKDTSYHAISPEGLLYRVRYVKNYPKKEIEFWQEALKNQLIKEGYHFIEEKEFELPGRKGVMFEWGAPYGNENYIYLTAIAVFGDRIAVAEAAGEHALYHLYRDALIKSLSTISLH
jgi:hypothetical protein